MAPYAEKILVHPSLAVPLHLPGRPVSLTVGRRTCRSARLLDRPSSDRPLLLSLPAKMFPDLGTATSIGNLGQVGVGLLLKAVVGIGAGFGTVVRHVTQVLSNYLR